MSKCAFEYGEHCLALTKKNCTGCRFKKTEEQLEAGRKKAQLKLLMLPKRKLNAIRSKYYKGMKWYG
jgi:hypothetical protein